MPYQRPRRPYLSAQNLNLNLKNFWKSLLTFEALLASLWLSIISPYYPSVADFAWPSFAVFLIGLIHVGPRDFSRNSFYFLFYFSMFPILLTIDFMQSMTHFPLPERVNVFLENLRNNPDLVLTRFSLMSARGWHRLGTYVINHIGVVSNAENQNNLQQEQPNAEPLDNELNQYRQLVRPNAEQNQNGQQHPPVEQVIEPWIQARLAASNSQQNNNIGASSLFNPQGNNGNMVATQYLPGVYPGFEGPRP